MENCSGMQNQGYLVEDDVSAPDITISMKLNNNLELGIVKHTCASKMNNG